MDKLGRARKLLDEVAWLDEEIKIETDTFEDKGSVAANATRLKILLERLESIEGEIEINDDLQKDYDDGIRKLHAMIRDFDPRPGPLPPFPNL